PHGLRRRAGVVPVRDRAALHDRPVPHRQPVGLLRGLPRVMKATASTRNPLAARGRGGDSIRGAGVSALGQLALVAGAVLAVFPLIPTFVLYRSIGWLDTLLPLTAPHWLGGGAFNVFLIRQFYATLPMELDEASRVDGASSLRIWWDIVLPLSGPVLATVA